MMKYIRIFLEWVKNLFLNTYDDLTRPVVRPLWVLLVFPVLLVVNLTCHLFVLGVSVSSKVSGAPAHTVVPTIPVHTAGGSSEAADPLTLQADLCSGRPRQFVLNLDGTQIKLSIQE